MIVTDKPLTTGVRSDQRREHTRHLLRTNAVLRVRGRVDTRVRVLDASVGGCGIEHDEPLGAPGVRGQLQLAVPDSAGLVNLLTLTVELRYSILKGVTINTGLAFVALTAEQGSQLAALLRNRPVV